MGTNCTKFCPKKKSPGQERKPGDGKGGNALSYWVLTCEDHGSYWITRRTKLWVEVVQGEETEAASEDRSDSCLEEKDKVVVVEEMIAKDKVEDVEGEEEAECYGEGDGGENRVGNETGGSVTEEPHSHCQDPVTIETCLESPSIVYVLPEGKGVLELDFGETTDSPKVSYLPTPTAPNHKVTCQEPKILSLCHEPCAVSGPYCKDMYHWCPVEGCHLALPILDIVEHLKSQHLAAEEDATKSEDTDGFDKLIQWRQDDNKDAWRPVVWKIKDRTFLATLRQTCNCVGRYKITIVAIEEPNEKEICQCELWAPDSDRLISRIAVAPLLKAEDDVNQTLPFIEISNEMFENLLTKSSEDLFSKFVQVRVRIISSAL